VYQHRANASETLTSTKYLMVGALGLCASVAAVMALAMHGTTGIAIAVVCVAAYTVTVMGGLAVVEPTTAPGGTG
jgi:hypothetical protein